MVVDSFELDNSIAQKDADSDILFHILAYYESSGKCSVHHVL